MISVASVIDLIHGRLVGAAVVHGDLLGNTAGLHRFVKKTHGCGLVALGGQQEVKRFAFLVRSAVLLHHLFELAVAHWTRRVPTNGHQRMHTKMKSIGKRSPLVASIAFPAFSVKAPSIDEPSCLPAKASEPDFKGRLF